MVLVTAALLTVQGQLIAQAFDSSDQGFSEHLAITTPTGTQNSFCHGWNTHNVVFVRDPNGGLLYCDPSSQRWRAPAGAPGEWCGIGVTAVTGGSQGSQTDCEYVEPRVGCPVGYTRMTARMRYNQYGGETDFHTCVVSP